MSGPLEREAGHDLNFLGRAGVLNGPPPAVQIGGHVDISITDAAFEMVVELEHPELGSLKQVGLPIKLRMTAPR